MRAPIWQVSSNRVSQAQLPYRRHPGRIQPNTMTKAISALPILPLVAADLSCTLMRVAKQRRRPLNNKIIAGNLAEANEEVVGLIFKAVHGGLKEEGLQIGLLHAYHHLNFAWNIRRARTGDYATLS